MRIKLKKLIRFLLESQTLTASTLADNLEVSVRSIKNYVKSINDEYPNTIISSNEGYRINKDNALIILSEKNNVIPQTSNERVSYIITQLIKYNSNESIDIYDLSDDLFISLSTLKIELNKVKRKLKKYDLELITKENKIKCFGLEKNKRKILSSILYDESMNNFVNIESIQHTFLDIDIPFIKSSILNIFNKYHYFINDYSLINLVLHISIAIDRIKNFNFNYQNLESLPNIKLHEYAMAKELAKQLEKHFNIKYSDAEIYEMTLLIISRATTIDYKSINVDNLEEFIGKECLELVHFLIQDVNAYYYIDLNEQEFLIRFALHIKNLLVRSTYDYLSKNPLTDSIKVSCPLIYDAAVNMARSIKEKMSISINDDEIAYIAFHLGSTIEAQKNLTSKIKTILFCPNYYDTNQRITNSINKYFSNEIIIKNIITDESEIDMIKDIDLMISSIPLSKIINFPFIVINPLLTNKDQKSLTEKINQIKHKKEQNKFEQYLRQLIIKSFFERKSGLLNEKEVIDYMYKKMKKEGYVDSTFKQEILEREKISSTAFANFAIPHAMKMFAKKTGINILISDDPINWNGQNIHLVMMMSFNRNERYIFNEIYEPITMILSETENIKKVLQCSDYEEFIKTMVSLI